VTSAADVQSAQARSRLFAALEGEHDPLLAILQEMPAGVLIAEAPSGRLVHGNAQVAHILGRPFDAPEEIHTFARARSFHPDGSPYRSGEWPLARSVRSGEVIAGEEVIFVRDDGTRLTLRVNSAPLRTADGRVSAAVLTFVDVSDLKRGEERHRFLAEAGAVLASSLDYETTLQSVARLAVPLLGDYCIVDVVDEEGTVARAAVACADPRQARLAEELRLDAPGPSQSSAVEQADAGVRSVILRDVGDATIKGAALSPHHLAVMRRMGIRSQLTAPLRVRGRTLGAITLLMAGSDRRFEPEDAALAEELANRAALAIDNARLYAAEQRSRREAEAALAVRDQFLSMAAHELRTPLTTLKGHLELSERRLRAGSSPERITHSLATAGQQVNRLDRLVTELLDVSRLALGRFVLHREPLELTALVRRVVEAEASFDGSRELRLEMPSEPVTLSADADRLEQVLVNLIQNARKYSPSGSAIAVRVAAEPDAATVMVEDRGIGVPPEERIFIFEPFHRGSNVERHVSGLGLGLYIAREIARAHGGDLTLSSSTDADGGSVAGSAFTLRLPPRATNAPPASAPDPAGRVHHQLQLAALVVPGEQVTFGDRGEAALRAERQPLERQLPCRLVDPAQQLVLRLQFATLGRNQSQHHDLAPRHEA
jgi:signal transduction histidine kinase